MAEPTAVMNVPSGPRRRKTSGAEYVVGAAIFAALLLPYCGKVTDRLRGLGCEPRRDKVTIAADMKPAAKDCDMPDGTVLRSGAKKTRDCPYGKKAVETKCTDGKLIPVNEKCDCQEGLKSGQVKEVECTNNKERSMWECVDGKMVIKASCPEPPTPRTEKPKAGSSTCTAEDMAPYARKLRGILYSNTELGRGIRKAAETAATHEGFESGLNAHGTVSFVGRMVVVDVGLTLDDGTAFGNYKWGELNAAIKKDIPSPSKPHNCTGRIHGHVSPMVEVNTGKGSAPNPAPAPTPAIAPAPALTPAPTAPVSTPVPPTVKVPSPAPAKKAEAQAPAPEKAPPPTPKASQRGPGPAANSKTIDLKGMTGSRITYNDSPLDPNEMAAFLKANMRELKSMYERVLKEDSSVGGSLKVTLEVNNEGNPTRITFTGQNLNEKLMDHYAHFFARVRFKEGAKLDFTLVLVNNG